MVERARLKTGCLPGHAGSNPAPCELCDMYVHMVPMFKYLLFQPFFYGFFNSHRNAAFFNAKFCTRPFP